MHPDRFPSNKNLMSDLANESSDLKLPLCVIANVLSNGYGATDRCFGPSNWCDT